MYYKFLMCMLNINTSNRKLVQPLNCLKHCMCSLAFTSIMYLHHYITLHHLWDHTAAEHTPVMMWKVQTKTDSFQGTSAVHQLYASNHRGISNVTLAACWAVRPRLKGITFLLKNMYVRFIFQSLPLTTALAKNWSWSPGAVVGWPLLPPGWV